MYDDNKQSSFPNVPDISVEVGFVFVLMLVVELMCGSICVAAILVFDKSELKIKNENTNEGKY